VHKNKAAHGKAKITYLSIEPINKKEEKHKEFLVQKQNLLLTENVGAGHILA
jgi:hypothetical protein